MGEFISEDWGLEAMIGGCGDDNSAAMSCSFDPLLLNPQNYNTNDDFVHLFEANNITLSNEFDQLYKPFVPVFDDSMKIIKPELEMKKQKSSSSTVQAVKYKKRKNQHKRVVLHPEGHPSDTWAWRKYGQKPIKGSPYPRSYYKCSSSKGCLARKQVEQSSTDPGMFKISYSAEHNHSQPTRRSSLAGINRHKFTVQKTSSSSTDDSSTPKDSNTTNIIEEVILEQHIKNEENINLFIHGSQNECVFFDQDTLLLNDDFFLGLEDLDGLISESAFYNLL